MARKKPVVESAFILFDVLYEDGRRTSNRKVPSADVGGTDGERLTRCFLEAQDNKIAEMSGNPRGLIKAITRSPA
ncbi:MAG: hypothetical protein WCO00_05410 [Rhodospirillaceae bacterium]